MARYYFHVRRGQVTILDHEGVDCGDWVEAAKEGARRALEIEGREALLDLPSSKGMILINDEFRTILEVPFGADVDEDTQRLEAPTSP